MEPDVVARPDVRLHLDDNEATACVLHQQVDPVTCHELDLVTEGLCRGVAEILSEVRQLLADGVVGVLLDVLLDRLVKGPLTTRPEASSIARGPELRHAERLHGGLGFTRWRSDLRRASSVNRRRARSVALNQIGSAPW